MYVAREICGKYLYLLLLSIYIYKSQTLKSPFRCNGITPEPLNQSWPKLDHVIGLWVLSKHRWVSVLELFRSPLSCQRSMVAFLGPRVALLLHLLHFGGILFKLPKSLKQVFNLIKNHPASTVVQRFSAQMMTPVHHQPLNRPSSFNESQASFSSWRGQWIMRHHMHSTI